MSTFLISCGGTGGHLSPGIALAEGLTERGHRANLLISNKKVDARLAEKYPHLYFTRIPGAPFSLQPLKLVRFLISQTLALFFSFYHIWKTRPNCIVGFGGFTTASIIVAGFLLGIPVALHEANRVPGRAIRLLGGLARRLYLPPGVHIGSLRATRHFGLPVRPEIRRLPKHVARANLGLDPSQVVLVVLGGSQGAAVLNEWVMKNLELLAGEGIQIYCVTGLGKGTQELREFRTRGGQIVRAVFTPFSDRIADLLSSADLVVSRAGAGTIAEVIRCEVPAILIPYPYAADNHQWANALNFERQGGGIVIDQKYMGTLHREVIDMIFNDWLLQKFRSNLLRMDRENSLDVLLDDLEELCLTQRPPREMAAPKPA